MDDRRGRREIEGEGGRERDERGRGKGRERRRKRGQKQEKERGKTEKTSSDREKEEVGEERQMLIRIHSASGALLMQHLDIKVPVLCKVCGSIFYSGIYVYCACMLSCFSPFSLCDPMDCSLSGSSVHGTLQARVLEWVAMPSSRGSLQSRD